MGYRDEHAETVFKTNRRTQTTLVRRNKRRSQDDWGGEKAGEETVNRQGEAEECIVAAIGNIIHVLARMSISCEIIIQTGPCII